MPIKTKKLLTIFSAFSYTPVTILKTNSSEKPAQFVGQDAPIATRRAVSRLVYGAEFACDWFPSNSLNFNYA